MSDSDEIKHTVELEFGINSVMVRVAGAESNFSLTAKNPNSSAYSVFQILSGTYSSYGCTYPRGVLQNEIDCAKKIYAAEGSSPWNASKYSGFNGGWYK